MVTKLEQQVAQIVPREDSMEEKRKVKMRKQLRRTTAIFVWKERSRPHQDLLSAIFVPMENTSTMKPRTKPFMMNGMTVGIALQEITA